MKQLERGSSSISVNGMWPSLYVLSFSMKAFHFRPIALSPEPKGLASVIPVTVLSSIPSTVVYILPRVPGSRHSSSSGISNLQESLLNMSRRKSYSDLKWNVIFVAFSEIPPPCLISVVLFPQYSQLKAITMISLKNGMLATHILHSPGWKHSLH